MSESLASRTAANRDGWSSSATSPPNRGRRRSGRPGSRPSRPIGPRTHSSPSWATSCGLRSRPCSRSSPPPSIKASIPAGLRSSLEIVQRNVRLEARLIDDLLDQSLISLGRLRLRTELVDAHGLLHRERGGLRRIPPGGRSSSPASISPRRTAGSPPIRADSSKSSGTSSPTPRGIRPLAVTSRSARGTSRQMPSRSNSRTKVAASRRRSWTRSSSPSSRVQPTVPNDARAWASAYRSAGGSSKPTGEPSSRRVRVPGEGPLSESSSAPQTVTRSRRSIDRGRETRSPSSPPPWSPTEPRKTRLPATILLVEDNPDSLRALSMSLSLLGYEVRPANSLRDGLGRRRGRRIRPDPQRPGTGRRDRPGSLAFDGPGAFGPGDRPHRLRVRGRPEDVPGGGLRDAPHQAGRDEATRRGDSEYHPKTIDQFIIQSVTLSSLQTPESSRRHSRSVLQPRLCLCVLAVQPASRMRMTPRTCFGPNPAFR